MNTKMIQKMAVVLGVVCIAFTACKKDKMTTVTTTDDETTLAAQAASDMDNVAVYTPDGTSDIYIDDEGIASDFLIEASDIDVVVGPAGGPGDSMRNRVREHSLIHCLNGLHLTTEQKEKIRTALAANASCKETAVKRARAIYEELQKTYKGKAEVLVKKYKDGLITKAQLEASLKELRENFHRELRAKHLEEKLDDAMRGCLHDFLKAMRGILTEAQWKAFVACHKH